MPYPEVSSEGSRGLVMLSPEPIDTSHNQDTVRTEPGQPQTTASAIAMATDGRDPHTLHGRQNSRKFVGRQFCLSQR